MARRGGIQFGRTLRQRVVSYKSMERLITECVLTTVLVRLPGYVLYLLRRIVASQQGDWTRHFLLQRQLDWYRALFYNALKTL